MLTQFDVKATLYLAKMPGILKEGLVVHEVAVEARTRLQRVIVRLQ